MPELAETDPFRAYNFKLVFGEEELGVFTEVTGLEINIEAISYREGGANWSGVRKLPGRVDIGEITLKYGLTQNSLLWDWLMELTEGTLPPKRKNVSVVLYKMDGSEENMRWDLIDAWITNWRGAKLDAASESLAQVAIEEVTLVAERIKRQTNF
jgi:phage tail-like protein